MTGIEVLKEKMLQCGATKQQTESKTVYMVLEALTDFDFATLYDDRREAETIRNNIKELSAKYEDCRKAYAELCSSIHEKKAEVQEAADKAYAEHHKYIDDFNESLQNTETAEARDKLRLAQIFINTVDINSKYDNTAFIVGLAALLSGSGVNVVGEMKKINKDVFEGPKAHKTFLGRL